VFLLIFNGENAHWDYFKEVKLIFIIFDTQGDLVLRSPCLIIMARIMFCFKECNLWIVGFIPLEYRMSVFVDFQWGKCPLGLF
jgi:hypothetical protein